MRTPASKAPSDRYLYEHLAFRLEIWGQSAATCETIRRLMRSSMAMETQWLLRSHGFMDSDIAMLTGIHPKGCVCWECVRGLHQAVLQNVKRQQLVNDLRYRGKGKNRACAQPTNRNKK